MILVRGAPVRGKNGRFAKAGAAGAPPEKKVGGPWVGPSEDILWAAYTAQPDRWPALAGLRRQVRVGRYYLDFGLAGRKLGIEVDGLAFHGPQEAWAKHHQRHREIEALGWRIVRYTSNEAGGAPLRVLDEVNRLWTR
jgi:very-short-patch-repair endonuclease